MADIESLLHDLKKINPHTPMSVCWINPISPVLRVSVPPESIKLPEEYKYNPKTGNIIVTDKKNNSTQRYCVHYTGEKREKTEKHNFLYNLFRKKKVA